MTDNEYAITQSFLESYINIIAGRQLDWNGFLERIEIADAAGPVLDPTLCREGRANMHLIRDLARATQAYQTRIKEILDAD